MVVINAINSVPVVMFHSVRPARYKWHWNYLSVSPVLFRSFLEYLQSKDYRTVLLPDVIAHNSGIRKLPPRSIALTFDDGYLDNWTIVAPLLKRFRFCGTVFVNPEFVDKRNIIRRQIAPDNEESVTRDLLDGFMSWQELKDADNSGVLDIQSHGMTHTWYFSSDRIIDFHHPEDNYPWIAWNALPERKHLWLEEDQSRFVEFGVPIYEYEKSFIARRCFPSSELNEILSSYVKHHGETAFFRNPDWRDQLFRQATSINTKSHYESDEEYRKRVEWELRASREEIGCRLNKRVDVICWPGGGYNNVTTEMAVRCGYKAWTVRGVHNVFNGTPQMLHRISVPLLKESLFGHYLNRLIFVYKVESSLGSGWWSYTRLFVPKLYALWKKLIPKDSE